VTVEGKIIRIQTITNAHKPLSLGMMITIAFQRLDEIADQRLRQALRTLSFHPDATVLHANIRPTPNTKHALWSMRPAQDGNWLRRPAASFSLCQTSQGNLTSTFFTLKNGQGRLIAACHDYQKETIQPDTPIVVVAPGYGETKRDYISLAYSLAANGCQVVRYDHTNHIGESEGEHADITLSSMKEDMRSVLKEVKRFWPGHPMILVASSLAGRVACKTASQDQKLAKMIILNCIVDVQSSLSVVHQEDLVAAYLKGRQPEMANVLGFNVKQAFLKDAIDQKWATLESTLEDAKRISGPVVFFSAQHDVWVDQHSLKRVYSTLRPGSAKWFVIPEALHRLQENPRKAKIVYRQVAQDCLAVQTARQAQAVIVDPSRESIGRQKHTEKERAKAHKQRSCSLGPEFWEDYLAHFSSIGKCPDYLKLLDHTAKLLGPLNPGHRVLDAGCGNGNFGMFVLSNHTRFFGKQRTHERKRIDYVGIDFVEEALERAGRNLSWVVKTFQNDAAYSAAPVRMTRSFAQVNLSQSLPFAGNQFDRIICNLVIGYLDHPTATIKELYRLLMPGGRMVLTNLKPDGDFSGIYGNLVQSTDKAETRKEARDLLNNYGKIRQAEKEGQFHFLTRNQWKEALTATGGINMRIYPTFANQAYVGVVEKPILQISRKIHVSTIADRKAAQRNQSVELGLVA